MKNKLKKWIRKSCPNIPILRDSMKRLKLKELKKYNLSENEIQQGEKDLVQRKKVVDEQIKKWSKHSAKIEKLLREYLKKNPELSNGMDMEAIKTNVLFDHYAYGFTPDEYFSFRLNGKNRKEKEAFISDRDRYIYAYYLNDIIDLDVFFDKFRTYQKFEEYFKRDAICIQSDRDYQSFCEFIKHHPVFVKKAVSLSRGEGVELIDVKKAKQSEQELFKKLITEGKLILEEVVIQSKEMKELNASSVNTVRCPTFWTKNGIELGPCRCRIGHDGSFVDNAGAGGILVGVNRNTGQLDSDGWDEHCRRYEIHPNSDIRFVGYQLPEWDKLVKTVKEMAAKMPNMRYISWDMAHTDDGWVLIEANGAGQFIGSQIVHQKGIKDEILKQLDGVLSV